ncbi:MAG: PaaI family thioesterase [Clostridiales bacterium]|nr:PaaI family thioesterase [Clostridiales bacterium]
MDLQELERVRTIFAEDKYATDNGAYIEEIGDNYAKCSMEITRHHRNAMGQLMGAACFTLADFTFAVAANWKKMGTVSVSTNATFLSKLKGEKIYAEAICKKDGRSSCFYEVSITDDLGTEIAVVTITGFKSGK